MGPSHEGRVPHSKILEWLREKGLPLEFRVAHAFANQDFLVWPGEYVATDDPAHPREIDVLAHLREPEGDPQVRFATCVECKWSGRNPWVVFASEHAQLGPSQAALSVIGNPTAQ